MSLRTFVCLSLFATILCGQDSRPESRPAAPTGVSPTPLSVSGLGLAGSYPGDRGVRSDSRVLFSDDFESDPPFATWTGSRGGVRTTGESYSGASALAITADPAGDAAAWLHKRLPEGQDRLFVRFYVKFPQKGRSPERVAFVTGDVGRVWDPYDSPGVCPDGGLRYVAGVGPFGATATSGGAWRLDAAWCEMTMSSDAKYRPNVFSAAPVPPAARDVWTCVEFMVEANGSPNAKDGEFAYWINGRAGARFEGLRIRTNPRLKSNGVWLSARVEKVDGAAAETVLYDDLVVATDYVGPRVEPESAAEETEK